jgi:hypothetical protein
MSKPAAGTLIASNALTTDMVFAYLLNGSLATTVVGGQFITGLMNSVGGAQPLSSNNANSGALNYDLATDSLVFPGADFLGLPTGLPIETTGGVSAITVLIGFEGDGTVAYNTVWEMQTGSDQEFDPYVNGHVLSAALSSSRGDYVPPTTSWFTAFNQLAVTGLAGGSLLSYINGVLADTRAADASIGIGVGPLIGSSFSPFKGKIQFFYAWTRVLSGLSWLRSLQIPTGLSSGSRLPLRRLPSPRYRTMYRTTCRSPWRRHPLPGLLFRSGSFRARLPSRGMLSRSLVERAQS